MQEEGPTRAPTSGKEKQPSTIRKFLASIWKRLKSAWASFTALFSTLFSKKDSGQEQTTANQEPVRAQEGPSGRQEAPESAFEGVREKQLTESQERQLDSIEEQGKEVARCAQAAKKEEPAKAAESSAQPNSNSAISSPQISDLEKLKITMEEEGLRREQSDREAEQRQADAKKRKEQEEREAHEELEKRKAWEEQRRAETLKTWRADAKKSTEQPSPSSVVSVSPIIQPVATAPTSETPITQPSKTQDPIDPKLSATVRPIVPAAIIEQAIKDVPDQDKAVAAFWERHRLEQAMARAQARDASEEARKRTRARATAKLKEDFEIRNFGGY